MMRAGVVVVVLAALAADARAQDPDLEGMPAPPDAPTTLASTPGPSARWNGRWYSLASTDLQHDRPGEDVAELHSRLDLDLGVEVSRALSLSASGRLRYDVLRPEHGDARYGWETELRELVVSVKHEALTLRLGQQTLRWGSADLYSPNDVINPVDYRDGFTPEVEVPLVPVPAVQLKAAWASFALEGVLVPVFVPHRQDVFGSDWSLLDPHPVFFVIAQQLATDFPQSSWEDVQALLAGEHAPEEAPQNASLGGRITFHGPQLDLHANVFYGWDRNPDVALGAGVGLDRLVSSYRRRLFTGLDGAVVLGPVVLKLDAAFSPEATFYTEQGQSVHPAVVSYVAGLEHQLDTHWHAIVEFIGVSALDPPPAGDAYLYADQTTLQLGAHLRRTFLADDLALEATGRFGLTRRDWFVAPRASYRVRPGHEVAVGAMLVGGAADSLGGLYGTNDLLFGQYTWSF
jgi:hypothetical protein